jgi:hypothetical protein
MLQAHSLLWNYLWVAPNVLLLALAVLVWRRGLGRQFPAFLAFAVLTSLSELAVYAADVIPSVGATAFWRIDWASLLIQGPAKFLLIGEIFAHVFGSYASIAKLGTRLIRVVGIVLAVAAALIAAYAPQGSRFGIVSGAHLLEQTIFFSASGLLLFIFLFSAYFRLRLEGPIFGIAVGLAASCCVHLATWAVIANGGLPNERRTILDLLNMATYHVCVLVWFYYLLVPARVATKSTVSLPEHSLELWNQELERLLQR